MLSEKQVVSSLPLVVDVSGKTCGELVYRLVCIIFSYMNIIIMPSVTHDVSPVFVAGRGITEVAQIPGAGRNVAALTADNNRLASLKGLHNFASLVQVSLELARTTCLVAELVEY